MLQVTRISLKSGNVAGALSSIKHALLPEQIKNDEYSTWVLSFDENNPKKRLGDASWAADGHHDFRAVITQELYDWLLKPTLSFYFSALLQIGQDWVAAAEALEDCERLMQGDNLARSVKNFASLAPVKVSQVAVDDNMLGNLARTAASQHEENIKRSQAAWTIWRAEVASLRGAVYQAKDMMQYSYDRGQLDADWVPTFVRACMKETSLNKLGYDDNRDFTLSRLLGIINSYGVMALLRGGRDEKGGYRDFEYFYRDLEHLINRLVEIERQQLLAPLIKKSHDLLEQKYTGTDPFTRYQVCAAAPDELLIELIKENTFGHEQHSVWLDHWLRTLVVLPYHAETWLEEDEPVRERQRVWGFRTADSTIKKHLNDGRSGVFLEHHLQELFEYRWIQDIARLLFSKESRHSKQPTFEAFVDFLTDVVERMSSIGYSLKIPNRERLRTLVDKVSRGESYYRSW